MSEALEEQYGFAAYYGSERRDGWLLNYSTVTLKDGRMSTKLYMIDDCGAEFLVQVPYFPSLLVKASDYDAVEEYLGKRYAGEVLGMERVRRVDFKEHNHLNKAPGEFLKVRLRTEAGFGEVVRAIKKLAVRNKARRSSEYDCFGSERTANAEDLIVAVCEWDVPTEVCVANELGIRCGKWYGVRYTGDVYVIEKSDKIVFPDLRILAFDIETSKKPLQFPNAECDEVMMISIKTEAHGELIVNRRLVSKDVRGFEYSPKEDMQCVFSVENEDDEEGVMVRFVEAVQRHRPHLITTFNGGMFDFPFLEKRMSRYGISLEETTGFVCKDEYYVSPFIVHLDCYKWVKRDSYLPAGSQGLKAVTRAKLGYFPDEVDPEDMVGLAESDPDKMASYSVSDAVATYFLYTKYVQPHVFSICSLIPLPPTSGLCQGSGTLSEALLISEAVSYGVLIPERRREGKMQEYRGHIAESITYVGGHVECLKAGIFRSDFEYDFCVDEGFVDAMCLSLDEVFSEHRDEEDFEAVKERVARNLRENKGAFRGQGAIYHLDVGAMYPNIILTNKLQPVSIVDEDTCIRCDFSDESNGCKKKMEWTLKVEYIPATREETERIRRQIRRERGFEGDEAEELKLRARKYSREMYRKTRVKENKTLWSTVCQREVPFYVETVRKFRDQRYIYKKLHLEAQKAVECAGSDEERKHAMKAVVVYSSLQVAHKCVLNSFYGYVMRKSSRWYSMEMAAIVCNVGGSIIRKAKDVVERIGISLELDTDGIWCIVPASLVSSYVFSSGKKASLLASVLNHFVCKEFTNHQYQEMCESGYATRAENSIFFEIDGPYRAMLLPASTEESRLLKKRYAIIDDDNRIAELKGFEVKRRGELEIIKKFQEELFLHFLDGQTLVECYGSLAEVCNYWLDILRSRGGYLDDGTILELLSESRSMSKGLSEYGGKKSNLTVTARRMSELLGEGILGEKLKCEYVVAVYPEGGSVAERAIPVVVFRSGEKERLLRQWLGREYPGDIRAIIDWDYYRLRLESVMQRMVILPALSQGVRNPVREVQVPAWARSKVGLTGYDFKRVRDIEDVSGRACMKKSAEAEEEEARPEEDGKENAGNEKRSVMDVLSTDLAEYARRSACRWVEIAGEAVSEGVVVKLECTEDGHMDVYCANRIGAVDRVALKRTIYIQTASWRHFEESGAVEKTTKYLAEGGPEVEVGVFEMKESEFVGNHGLYRRFLSHFSIRRVFEDKVPILYSNLRECGSGDVRFVTVSSFVHQGKAFYAVGGDDVVFIPFRGSGRRELESRLAEGGRWRIVVMSSSDPHKKELASVLSRCHVLEMPVRVELFPKGYAELCDEQRRLHGQMAREMDLVCKTSRYTGVPVFNVDEDVLDMVFYRELRASGVVCGPEDCEESHLPYLGAERFRPGLYAGYVVEVECVGTMVLSIIEYKAFLGDDTLFEGVGRRDFCVLRSFLKRIVLDSVRGEEGTRVLLRNAASWIRKKSKVVSQGLREVCCMLQRRYMMHLAKRLTDKGYDVVSVAGDVVMVSTGKTGPEAAGEFFEHVCKRAREFCGYEMMKMRLGRRFARLALVSPSSYFFAEGGKYFCFSDHGVPTAFLRAYFDDGDIDAELVYGVVTRIPVESARVVLSLLSLRPGTEAVRANCYKLLRLSEFEEDKSVEVSLDVVCPLCGTEGVLRARCTRCYKAYPRRVVLEACMDHARRLLRLELAGDSYCDRCGGINEKRLSDFCKCGGAFRRTGHRKELDVLKRMAASATFDDFYEKVSGHFSE